MNITAVDSTADLFRVDSIYPLELLAEFAATDHLQTEWKKEDWQDQYPRRRLIYGPDSVYAQLENCVRAHLHSISTIVGIDIVACDTGFWLDLPGFCMSPHLDNSGVSASMQVYLNINESSLGTVFYNLDGSIRYQSPYAENTGYIMINGPQQTHGMDNPVPDSSYRISSYTWFYPKV
jgi:hypothetical protein